MRLNRRQIDVAILALMFSIIAALLSLWLLTLLSKSDDRLKHATNQINWTHQVATAHDQKCFTQGLEFISNNVLAETCGLYGQSRVQLIDLSEHRANPSIYPKIIRSTNLPQNVFAEGITQKNGDLYVITWRERQIFILDSNSLAIKKRLFYPLEGWGISYRKSTNSFLATDGSPNIYHLSIDNDRVSLIRTVPVVCRGRPVSNLNELELIGEELFANVWLTNYVYRLNPDTGNFVEAHILCIIKVAFKCYFASFFLLQAPATQYMTSAV